MTDTIFMLRQIQQKCREHNTHLCAAFEGLTKAFDAVSHDGQWKKILVHTDHFPKCLTIFCQLNEGQQGQVKQNRSLSGSIPIYNGDKHGCILTPKIVLRLLWHHAQ